MKQMRNNLIERVKILDSHESKILETIKSKGYWKVTIRPTTYQKDRISLDELKNIIQQCQVRQRGWYYPVLDPRTGKTYHGNDYLTSLVNWNEFIEVWRFYRSGKFVQYYALVEDGLKYPPYSTGKNLEIILALYHITEFFIFAKNLASKKIMGDTIRIEIELHNTSQRKLIAEDIFRALHDSYICQVNDLEVFKGDIPLPKMLADFAEIALDATVKTYNKFNWLNLQIKDVLRNDQEKLLKGFF